ncbi:MAG: TonB-dependent receptor plug domain-containing protein [Synergistaceae bacterium]|nr:TonB-dependent receptor plug domain-containing protein [Synergistaceae bacterium]
MAVYVDGVPMNLQSESAVNLARIPVDEVERIEVYRGYIPAQFGAQAMGGVINVITKMPKKPSMDVSMGVGSFGLRKGAFSYASQLGGGKFFSALGYETYDGDFEYWNDNNTPYNSTDDYTGRRNGNGHENVDALLKWEDARWRARASWARRNRDLSLQAPGMDKPGAAPYLWPLQDTDRLDLSLGRRQTSGAVNWEWRTDYTYQDRKYNSRRGNNASAIGDSAVTKSEYETTRAGFSLSAGTALGERHYLELLGAFADERLDVGGDIVYTSLGGIEKYGEKSWNFSLQDTIALDKAGTFLATPSLRWHKAGSEDHLTWQIALTKEISSSLMFKGSYGAYSRFPNLRERYGDGAFVLPATSDLRWETGVQADLGLVWNTPLKLFGSTRLNTSLSAFWRETDDLIEFFMTSPRYGIYSNIAKSTVKGVELETSLDWKKWGLSFAATWLDGENKTPDARSVRHYGKALPNRPEWSGTARVTRRFDWGSVFAEYRYTGENYADASEKVLFDARKVVSIGLKYNISPSAHLTLGVNDLFNDADDWRMRPDGYSGPVRVPWFPVEGRSFYLNLNMDL